MLFWKSLTSILLLSYCLTLTIHLTRFGFSLSRLVQGGIVIVTMGQQLTSNHANSQVKQIWQGAPAQYCYKYLIMHLRRNNMSQHTVNIIILCGLYFMWVEIRGRPVFVRSMADKCHALVDLLYSTVGSMIFLWYFALEMTTGHF